MDQSCWGQWRLKSWWNSGLLLAIQSWDCVYRAFCSYLQHTHTHSLTQRDNRQAVFGPTKSDCARPPSVFARFSTCWLPFVPKSEIPLEGAPLWLVSGHPESRDKYIKHHCKGRLLQRHPEAVWPCKSVCTVTRDLYRKLNNKSVISFTQILFIMPVLKLRRRTVYITKFNRLHIKGGARNDVTELQIIPFT